MPRPSFIRKNIDDPKVMAGMLRNGMIWNAQTFWPKAIDAINAGLVPLDECKNIPPEVRAQLKGSK
jgi:hypothetical protein